MARAPTISEIEDRVAERASELNAGRLPFGDPMAATEAALDEVFEELASTGQAEVMAAYIPRAYPYGSGAEDQIRRLIAHLAGAEAWPTLDRFCANLLARRVRPYLDRLQAQARYDTAVEIERQACASALAEARAWLEPHDPEAASVYATAAGDLDGTYRSLADWRGYDRIDQTRICRLAGEVSAGVEASLGYDRIAAMHRDIEEMDEGEGDGDDEETRHQDAFDAAYHGALTDRWGRGGREEVLCLATRLIAERRLLEDELVGLRDHLAAHAREIGDRAAWREIWQAHVAGFAWKLDLAVRERDATPSDMRGLIVDLFTARERALTALAKPDQLDRVIEDRQFAERGEARPPPPVTDKGPVDEDRFWDLIDRARNDGGSTAEVLDRLRATLSGFSPKGIKGFERQLGQRLKDSFTWDLWALAYAVMAGCGDDAFDYFRCWLILQGRKVFDLVLEDPDAAWRNVPINEHPEAEDLLATAYDAMDLRGEDPSALPAHPNPRRPKGQPFDEAAIDQRFKPEERAR